MYFAVKKTCAGRVSEREVAESADSDRPVFCANYIEIQVSDTTSNIQADLPYHLDHGSQSGDVYP